MHTVCTDKYILCHIKWFWVNCCSIEMTMAVNVRFCFAQIKVNEKTAETCCLLISYTLTAPWTCTHGKYEHSEHGNFVVIIEKIEIS